jgi:hypothetical protein
MATEAVTLAKEYNYVGWRRLGLIHDLVRW